MQLELRLVLRTQRHVQCPATARLIFASRGHTGVDDGTLSARSNEDVDLRLRFAGDACDVLQDALNAARCLRCASRMQRKARREHREQSSCLSHDLEPIATLIRAHGQGRSRCIQCHRMTPIQGMRIQSKGLCRLPAQFAHCLAIAEQRALSTTRVQRVAHPLRRLHAHKVATHTKAALVGQTIVSRQ